VGGDAIAHPNAVSMAGHTEGALAFRWFLAEEVPDRPTVEVVQVVDAPTAPDDHRSVLRLAVGTGRCGSACI
jgi:hypothetical protein